MPGEASNDNVESPLQCASPSQKDDSRYVKLDPEYMKTLTWSNDPRDLDLKGAFSDVEPNLATHFRIPGPRPIIKENDGDDTWILQDANGRYYLWDAWVERLFKIAEHWTTGPGLENVEDVVENIICNFSWVEEDAERVWRTKERI